MNWDEIGEDFLSIADDRVELLLPCLLSVANEMDATSVVDVGGGDGRFLSELRRARKGSRDISVALVDPSPIMRQQARTVLANIPSAAIVASASEIGQGNWNLVLSIAVWMSLETEEECFGHLKSLNGLLSPRGRVVIAVTHPCFRDRTFHTYSTNFDMSHYRSSGKRFQAYVFDGKKSIVIEDTHWTLADHVRQLTTAGLVVERIVEVPDKDKESSGVPWLVLIAKRA
jgi:hypothetical protein